MFERPDLYYKFRVWDKHRKIMYYLNSSARISDLWKDDRIPMQFIGIKDDCNTDKEKCKPIYEGDIVRRVDTNTLGIVKYITNKARFEIIWIFDTYVLNDNFEDISTKIIVEGNIFEDSNKLFKENIHINKILKENFYHQ